VAARRALVRAVYEAGTLVAPYPAVALRIARWRGHGVPVGERTDVLIEGYPRSANSFAVAAFETAQTEPIRVAHHTHASANVIAAVRRGVPALVLVREPEDAVVEFVLLKPELTVGQALRGWVRFYRPLLPFRGRFVIARTDEVVTDLSAVIARVNDRFGTGFAPFEPTEESLRTVQERIGAHWEGRIGPGLPLVGRTRRTDEDQDGERGRDAERTRLHAAFRAPRLERARLLAAHLHETLTSGLPGRAGA
jgi:hypothetical protein